ncbi:nitroreductase family protein [Falsiroseomonas selenitidurans]|uniref:Putative NAD(P)H nitroreductase n=1 Tax=Falsiroseomonas selenitidurans TaxID=2716335 RepID=A0ABX1EAG7_9PROT|nr:nitroreductase [Falsiroseomonas selenitidurans]NKC33825.1 nitroreductase [Falsiroseomonas selenitidurans]
MPEAPFPTPEADANPALHALLARASVPPRLLHDPAPDAPALAVAVAAALRAPDHGGLRPWRFLGIQGEARARLGDLLAQSMLARAPETPEARLALERAKPLRAPLLVAAGAALRPHPKIPDWEQEATAAAGIMNFLNALDAQGFGCCWLSSPALQDPAIKAALGFAETDRLLGWIYVGTPAADRPRPVRPAVDGFWRDWAG